MAATNRDDNQDKIIGYIDYIQKHPKELKYFSFDEGRKFIVDGNKIKMLPTEYAKYYQKDEFYISVDPDKRKVIYYAFDVEDYTTNKHKDESLGFFEWDKVSEQIFSFLTLHLKELTTATTPYSDIVEKKTGTTTSSSSHGSQAMSHYDARRFDSDYPTSGFSGGHNHNRGFDNSRSSSSTSNWNNSYREREAFCNKVTDLCKDCKTSLAIDHINTQVKKLCEEKKFEDLDNILRWITFDKLNIPTMIALLDTTRGADHILKERKEFFGKVKTHLMKIKPARAEHILRNTEPGKEYKDVVKYQAK
jgi:hypothetical protein